MKAAVFYGKKDVRVEDVDDPSPGPGEVLLRPLYCGICGTDVDAWNRGMYAPGVVLGHEVSARVVECGPEVEGWHPGDMVVANSVIPCGACSFCAEGKYSLCDNVKMPGITVNGGLAELLTLPADSVLQIPDSIAAREAALTEPLAVVLHGFSLIRSRWEVGHKALVTGAGTLGLLAMQVVLAVGSSFVAVSEPNSARRGIATKLGADLVIDPSGSNVWVEFSEKAGRLPDLVVECSGSPHAAAETFSLARKGGTVLILGISEEPVEADFMTAVLNELTFQYSYCGYSEFSTALTLLEKKMIRVGDLITEIALEDVVEKGFRILTNPQSEVVKLLVKIS
ncbi:MAG: alcohol dehydrogenase catalytic domain-containing protein [Theionarchaea archaeon]|nr:alcohol dehydrogenase catalytic domain-containing protein [Theionarchaea archaeon]MBU7034019.1 alcohol dehydrogenase catalytic domain-containing protein [Theionarchaea archaeon]MBU7039554.1 alcohol dehydrogenase catalytic domain-containing protein [Theionarchaea archaeon]